MRILELANCKLVKEGSLLYLLICGSFISAAIALQIQMIDQKFPIHNQLTRQVPAESLILDTMLKV